MARQADPSDSKSLSPTQLQTLGLDGPALQAFETLCDESCDPKTLGGLLLWLTTDSPKFSRVARSMDSIKVALGGISMRNLDRLPSRLRAVAANLKRAQETLRRLTTSSVAFRSSDGSPPTKLVMELSRVDAIDHFLRYLEERAKWAEELLGLARTAGPRKAPDRNRVRRTLNDYVVRSTGRPHDAELSTILSHMTNRIITPDNVKMQRTRLKARPEDRGRSSS